MRRALLLADFEQWMKVDDREIRQIAIKRGIFIPIGTKKKEVVSFIMEDIKKEQNKGKRTI